MFPDYPLEKVLEVIKYYQQVLLIIARENLG